VDIAHLYEIAKAQSQQMNKNENPVHAVKQNAFCQVNIRPKRTLTPSQKVNLTFA